MIELKDSPFWKYFTEDVDAPENPAAAYADHAEICRTYFSSLPESKSAYRYAPGKWSVKQVVGHVTDANLVFLYRLVAIARGETNPLPGFDENAYADNAPHDSQAWRAVLDGYRGVAQAAGALISGLDAAAWSRSGCANGTRLTPRDMLWVLIGHERHHIRTLKERYGLK
ncbi:MAG TPA: DinB family protein [Fibrobacteria bacterium]|nr:DinB family protein [Fibrobacteria bacterium]